MSKRASENYDDCFYCGAFTIGSKNTAEGDHFPVPARLGGILTVRACVTCHSMKDNFRLDDWSVNYLLQVSKALLDDLPKLSRDSRIILAKFLQLFMDLMFERGRLKLNESELAEANKRKDKRVQLLSHMEPAA